MDSISTRSRIYNTLKVGLPVLLTACLLQACDKATLGTKSLTENLPASTIQGFPIPQELLEPIPIPLSASADSAADDTQFVTFAKLRNLRLDILENSEQDANDDGAMDNFDFLSGMEIYLNAEINGEAQEVLVASLPEGDPQIAAGVRSINLTVNDIDVLDYIEAPDGYGLRVEGTGMVPPDDVIFGGEVRYRVGVGLRTDRLFDGSETRQP